MKEWANLSTEERQQAREKFKNLQQLPPEKRANVKEKWESYLQLPEEQRETLRTEGPRRGAQPLAVPVASGSAGSTAEKVEQSSELAPAAPRP